MIMPLFRPNFDVNATEGDVNEEVEFAIKTPAGPFGFGSAVELDNDQVDDDDDVSNDDGGGDDNHCHHNHYQQI